MEGVLVTFHAVRVPKMVCYYESIEGMKWLQRFNCKRLYQYLLAKTACSM